MILSLRQIKGRIKSVESTKKITRAMQMVSTAKFKRSENMLETGRPYYRKLDSILTKLLLSLSPEQVKGHPLLEEREGGRKFALCMITSDSGLCSVYNNNIIRLTEKMLKQRGKDNVKIIAVGRKGFVYFSKRGAQIVKSYLGLHGRYSAEIADRIAKDLIDMFLNHEADEIYIAHSHFESATRYKPDIRKFLSITPPHPIKGELEFIADPGIDEILNDLIPKYLSIKMRLILLDAFTTEHSSRTIAMQSATDNAVELIDSLTLMRNKARQASITNQVLEVATSAEALK
ncbi:MAG: ATP synthase F1 subunit gamma [Candidatus Omnitrophota bacterium]|jgi:F-type H+-transporting ATPase subunit gamma